MQASVSGANALCGEKAGLLGPLLFLEGKPYLWIQLPSRMAIWASVALSFLNSSSRKEA